MITSRRSVVRHERVRRRASLRHGFSFKVLDFTPYLMMFKPRFTHTEQATTCLYRFPDHVRCTHSEQRHGMMLYQSTRESSALAPILSHGALFTSCVAFRKIEVTRMDDQYRPGGNDALYLRPRQCCPQCVHERLRRRQPSAVDRAEEGV